MSTTALTPALLLLQGPKAGVGQLVGGVSSKREGETWPAPSLFAHLTAFNCIIFAVHSN